MALDPKFKKKWVKALRSGKFSQTKGKLFNGKDGFCCLGVAAHIGMPEPWEQNHRGEWEVCGQSTNLPRDFREEIGLTYDDEETLVQMNDTEGRKFKTIANYIEENL